MWGNRLNVLKSLKILPNWEEIFSHSHFQYNWELWQKNAKKIDLAVTNFSFNSSHSLSHFVPWFICLDIKSMHHTYFLFSLVSSFFPLVHLYGYQVGALYAFEKTFINSTNSIFFSFFNCMKWKIFRNKYTMPFVVFG